MASSAKFATDDMKSLAATRAQSVAAGTPGPQGNYPSLVDYLPQPIPTEAWGLWNKDGYLMAAWSADNMNAWYFHLDAEELPHYSVQTYSAQDNQGETIELADGESAIMSQYIQGQIPYFFINGERFTETGTRTPEGHSYFMTCSGVNGRAALVHLDTAGTGASIFIYSSGNPVGTDERLGISPSALQFESTPVDSRTLPGLLAGYANETYAPFWALAE